MPIVRTLEPRRFNDEWSFSGRGRFLYKRAIPQVRPARTGIIEGDGPAREMTPIGPGEPRG